MKRILLHTCCGPCFLGSYKYLSDFEITSYFYNPNIQPEEEYFLRLANLKKAINGKSKNILVGKYQPEEHQIAIAKDDSFPVRCGECYKLRLEKTAQTAKMNGFKIFSTTLLVSPYQQHQRLKEIGEQITENYGLEFYYEDFRKNYREGQNLAREMGIYRQKYCGCLLSKSEASELKSLS